MKAQYPLKYFQIGHWYVSVADFGEYPCYTFGDVYSLRFESERVDDNDKVMRNHLSAIILCNPIEPSLVQTTSVSCRHANSQGRLSIMLKVFRIIYMFGVFFRGRYLFLRLGLLSFL